jgi:hypothetical protein
VALHWDGSSWSQVTTPDPGGDSVLTDVSAVSGSDVWALGGGGGGSFALHWNGTSWTVVPLPDPGGAQFTDVTAVSASSVWAVGSDESSGVRQTLTVHWDGSSWTQVPSPDPGGTAKDNLLYSVTATSSGDVWAVGDYDTPRSPPTIFPVVTPVVLHWNGSSWSAAALDTSGQGTGNLINGVAASSTGQAWVVGYGINNAGQAFAAPVPVVPDVSGRTVGGALAVLGTYGLSGGTLSQTTNCPASSQGLIVANDPATGQMEPFGLAVNLTTCVAPAPVTVPNVLSMGDTSAQRAITAAGLTVGPISMVNSCADVAGTVLTQNPAGGQQAPPGSAVSLSETTGLDSRGKPCVFN